MGFWKRAIATALVGGSFLLPELSSAATRGGLTGSIVGFVGDSTGVAQMGAAVLLFNRNERLLQRTITNEKGAFGFDSLLPDVYSLRVSLASFVPALKQNILVQPGMRSFLSINLASVFSSIELIYMAPGQGSLMSDDWKWVLRSSISTRPVLRLVPQVDLGDGKVGIHSGSGAFELTRGMVKLSAGDAGLSGGFGTATDLGTAFALATSLYGVNHLQFSGNLGYASLSGAPSAGFSTRFSRQEAGSLVPDVQLTMRQVFLPGRAGTAFAGIQQGSPELRSLSLALHERARVGENLHLDYGVSMESVSFLDRLNYISPYALLEYDAGEHGIIEIGYSSGVPPVELRQNIEGSEGELQDDDLARLAVFPRVSREHGQVRVQRSENFEMAYRKDLGGRTFGVGFYRESVSNAALLMSGSTEGFSAMDLLPDLSSRSSIFNIGSYSTWGYTASITQPAADWLNMTLAYGNGGALRTENQFLDGPDPDGLRGMIRPTRRNWVTTKVSGTLPRAGTRFISSYVWTYNRSLTPGHRFLTQRTSADAGINLYVRQPIPSFGTMAGRLEATAELRNLLAQGYLPVSTSDGRQVVLIHSPRVVRGGLSFIF
jgi:hypothetical protein